MITLKRETPEQIEVAALLAQADARSAALYPAESRHGLSIAALIESDVRFLVARRSGRAVGCGGLLLLPEATGELKRLFVDPAARGQGVGGAIVSALEQLAGAEGVCRLFLETGVKSLEALRLYERLGYATCLPFAAYRPDPLSVFMTKTLA